MHPLEMDLRYLGVLEKALQIASELGPGAAVRYIRSSYHLLSKVYHPDLHSKNRVRAEEGQKRLNAIKERLDMTTDKELSKFLGGQATRGKGHPRILVVEDEDGLRENLADLLTLEGYHVAEANNGMQGLKMHLSFRPELVITDVVMPIMDGVEMVRQLRERDPSLNAMFISGFFGTRSIKNNLMQEIEKLWLPQAEQALQAQPPVRDGAHRPALRSKQKQAARPRKKIRRAHFPTPAFLKAESRRGAGHGDQLLHLGQESPFSGPVRQFPAGEPRGAGANRPAYRRPHQGAAVSGPQPKFHGPPEIHRPLAQGPLPLLPGKPGKDDLPLSARGGGKRPPQPGRGHLLFQTPFPTRP